MRDENGCASGPGEGKSARASTLHAGDVPARPRKSERDCDRLRQNVHTLPLGFAAIIALRSPRFRLSAGLISLSVNERAPTFRRAGTRDQFARLPVCWKTAM